MVVVVVVRRLDSLIVSIFRGEGPETCPQRYMEDIPHIQQEYIYFFPTPHILGINKLLGR